MFPGVAMFIKLALREALLFILCLLCWRLDAALRPQGGVFAFGGALLAALSTVLVAFLAHEWGHLAGAWARGSVVYPPRSLRSVFVFYFDTDRNSGNQFVAMSLGGFATSALGVALLIAILPLDAWSGRIALALVGIGVIATLILEVPAAWKVARGAPLPRGPERPQLEGARTV